MMWRNKPAVALISLDLKWIVLFDYEMQTLKWEDQPVFKANASEKTLKANENSKIMKWLENI